MIDFIINTKSKMSGVISQPLLFSAELKIIHLPAIKIGAIELKKNQPSIDEISQELKNGLIDYVVISSVNSLNFCPTGIKQALIQSKTAVATVGPATKKLAKKMSLKVKLVSNPVGINSLLNYSELINQERFLFLKGTGGNENLINYLKKKSKVVRVVEVYLRKNLDFLPSQIKPILGKKCLWLFYSQSALISAYNNFKNNSSHLNWFLNQSLLCLSEAIVDKANELGFQSEISLINSMQNEAILKKINHLIQASKI